MRYVVPQQDWSADGDQHDSQCVNGKQHFSVFEIDLGADAAFNLSESVIRERRHDFPVGTRFLALSLRHPSGRGERCRPPQEGATFGIARYFAYPADRDRTIEEVGQAASPTK